MRIRLAEFSALLLLTATVGCEAETKDHEEH
jgi:hypothetical protein